jgi:NAD dependent epimerase/dehydratase family enzyme
MTNLPSLAIAGATGNLGFKVTKSILLPEFRSRFSDVFVLSRSDSDKAQELVRAGAKLRLYSEDDLASALDGIDVLINT